MTSFSGDTDIVNQKVIPAELRAYFSSTSARLRDEVWLRVEARWVSDGTPLAVALFRQDDDGTREPIKAFDGTLAKGVWEQKWTVDLPKERLYRLHGPLYLGFEATPDGHPTTALSPPMLVHRTRFSS